MLLWTQSILPIVTNSPRTDTLSLLMDVPIQKSRSLFVLADKLSSDNGLQRDIDECRWNTMPWECFADWQSPEPFEWLPDIFLRQKNLAVLSIEYKNQK